jgi:preprotein translocase subunit YajC
MEETESGFVDLTYGGTGQPIVDIYKLYSVMLCTVTFSLLIGVFLLSCVPSSENGQSGNPLISLLPIVLIFAVFYLLLIYPKQRQQKKHQQMLSDIKKGDEVITSSGIHGRVVGVGDSVVVLRIAENVKIEVEKSHVAAITKR